MEIDPLFHCFHHRWYHPWSGLPVLLPEPACLPLLCSKGAPFLQHSSADLCQVCWIKPTLPFIAAGVDLGRGQISASQLGTQRSCLLRVHWSLKFQQWGLMTAPWLRCAPSHAKPPRSLVPGDSDASEAAQRISCCRAAPTDTPGRGTAERSTARDSRRETGLFLECCSTKDTE